MSFFQLVRREMQGSLDRLAVMSGLGGVSNAAILAAINSGAQAAGNGEFGLSSAALFVIALLLFIKTQHYILIATTVEIEAIIHKVRVRLMDQVRHSELLPLDAIGRAEIVAAITKETGTLTQATNMPRSPASQFRSAMSFLPSLPGPQTRFRAAAPVLE